MGQQKTDMKNQNEYPIHVHYKHDGCNYSLGGSKTIIGKSDDCLQWFIDSQTHSHGKEKVRGYLLLRVGNDGYSSRNGRVTISMHGKLQYWNDRRMLAMVWGDNHIEAKIADVESVYATYEPHSDGLDGFWHDRRMLRDFRIEMKDFTGTPA